MPDETPKKTPEERAASAKRLLTYLLIALCAVGVCCVALWTIHGAIGLVLFLLAVFGVRLQ